MIKYSYQFLTICLVVFMATNLNAAHLALIKVEKEITKARVCGEEMARADEQVPIPMRRLLPLTTPQVPQPRNLLAEKKLTDEMTKLLQAHNKFSKNLPKFDLMDMVNSVEKQGIASVCSRVGQEFRDMGRFDSAFKIYGLAAQYLPKQMAQRFNSYNDDLELYEAFSDLLRRYNLADHLTKARQAMIDGEIFNNVATVGAQLSSTNMEFAEKCLKMAARSGNSNAFDSLGSMFIDAYNNEAQLSYTPTPRLITYLQKAEGYLDQNAFDPSDTQYWIALKAKKRIYKFILWFSEHPQLTNIVGLSYDEIFRLYDKNMGIVHRIENCTTYGINSDMSDLMAILRYYGFRMTLWRHPTVAGAEQHIWVNEDGIMVRVKPRDAEYTVALTKVNPVIFDADGRISLAENNDAPIFNDYKNEILKFSLSFLIPTRHKAIWSDVTSDNQQNNLMDEAHYPLSSHNFKNAMQYCELTCN